MRINALKRAVSLCCLGFAVAATAAAPVLPGDDFFDHLNGDWLAGAEIPADRASWSVGAALAEATNRRIAGLIESVAADKAATGAARLVGDFYTAHLDEAGIEARGLAPLQPLLKAIAGIRTRSELSQALGRTLRADVDALNATDLYTPNLFGLWVTQGMNEPARAMPYLLQGGLGMPDRAYYVDDTPRMRDLRQRYQAHVAAMLAAAGLDDAERRAARVMALELQIAAAHSTREDSSDVLKANNTWLAKDFPTRAPGMDWAAYFRAAGLGEQADFIVWQPGAVRGAAALVASVDLQSWQDYLAFHTINQFAGVLPRRLADLKFAFHGRALSGTPEQAPRWKLALAATNEALVEPVGQLYVARYFPAEHKARIRDMTGRIVAAFSARIDKLAWMAPSTRAEAQAKLKTLYIGIGYPDRWASYAGLVVSPTDAFGNQQRSEQFRLAQQLAKLKQPVDRGEWAMPAQLVNAVNLPMQNAINMPAAILQPPFYDPAASAAQNYGAIGAVIGHELSHSFDDAGAQFDAAGRLRDWWTPADSAHFKAQAAALVAQFSAYRPFADLAVSGQQTLSENLADLAGLAAAYDAFAASLGGRAPTAEEQRQFFAGYAACWRSKVREAAQRQSLIGGVHAPARYRAWTVRNLDAWYDAYDVRPGQSLYLAPGQRVRVW
jgi:putative endopeptidase